MNGLSHHPTCSDNLINLAGWVMLSCIKEDVVALPFLVLIYKLL